MWPTSLSLCLCFCVLYICQRPKLIYTTERQYLQSPWCPIKYSSLGILLKFFFSVASIHLHGHWLWVVVAAATAVIFNQISYGNKLTNKLLYLFIRIISVFPWLQIGFQFDFQMNWWNFKRFLYSFSVNSQL